MITLKGVGTKIAEKLAKLQIFTVGDLLLHCPYRYEDRTRITPINQVQPDQLVVVQGEIIHVKMDKGRKKRCMITLSDDTGALQLVFFHFQASQQQQWQLGVILRCFGQVNGERGLQIVHPEYQVVKDENDHVGSLTPVYPSVAGLTQGWFRRTLPKLLSMLNLTIPNTDPLLAPLTGAYQMLPWLEALNTIHRPAPEIDHQALSLRQHPAYWRLIAEELLVNHLSLMRLREAAQARLAPRLTLAEKTSQAFLGNLPFQLTSAQEKVWQQIQTDIAQTIPMLRLVQGDVGCGKTVVAALAALTAVSSNVQVAFMAPTEILAEQHYTQLTAWFSPLGYRCELLTGKLKAKAKRSVLENITLGLANVVIGTHALFQETVSFHHLGLVIIDEQHRFGVHQRLSLQQKGSPHQLIMTATPIPRTLAMSHYAHLDISIIDSLPPGRQPITTLAIPQGRREEIIARMEKVCASGQQIYWVCTLIEESDTLTSQAAAVTAEQLQALLPHYSVGLVHGRMTSDEKESVMQAFYRGDLSILVATTVIEVGVNVPNATLMVIENPERLGLSQLHQLRGRVGRGKAQSYCILLYQSPLSQMAQARLQILRESCDGFVIAEADLALRGPGEILGTRQTGAIAFKIADLKRDKEFIKMLPSWGEKVSALLSSSQIEYLIQRWGVGSEYGEA